MLKNNNKAVITRMAKRSLRSRKGRTATILLAVMLSSFLLFSFFTIGITYLDMQHIQNIRLNGAEFDAILYGLTDEQRSLCENNPDITETGICAVTGYAIETDEDSTIDVGFLWADDTYWNKMMASVRTSVQGTYPQKADEIMVTKEALSECGLSNLNVGDSFVMTFGDKLGEHTKKFRISGLWEGYGAKKVFFVSKSFYEQSGWDLSSVSSGRYYMNFKHKILTQKKQDAFIESMHLGKKQNLFFVSEVGNSIQILMGLIGLALIACLCAYLLIYNIMYLSVSENIRHYGLLGTIGMTERQIYQLMKKQMLFLGTIGISGGLLLGSSVSFFLVPTVVKSFGIYEKASGAITTSFHPAVFFLTIFLTGITIFAANKKPAKIAVSVPPTEALAHRPFSSKKKTKKTGKGKVLWKMAKEQITKDKKKAGFVMLSLAASLSMFLCMVTLLKSQVARTMVSNYMDLDLVIKNDTLTKEDRNGWKEIFDEALLNELQKSEYISEMHSIRSAEIMIPWDAAFADIWMQEFYETWMEESYEDAREEYKNYPENFGSFIIGIDEGDFYYLKDTLNSPIDDKAFLNGETCILYRNGLAFSDNDLAGKQITCALYDDAGHTKTFQIAALTDENYYSGALLGQPPTVIVYETALKEFAPNSLIYKTSVRYRQEYDTDSEEQILKLIEKSPYAKDFSYDSKIEELTDVEKAQGNMPLISFGMILILAFIGISNYINTSVGNIQRRQKEIAVMESIGMTAGQVKKMLVLEGALFAGGALCITWTFGLSITYVLYQSTNYRKIPFLLPLLPSFAAAAFVLLLCCATPLITYRNLEKRGTIAERISN